MRKGPDIKQLEEGICQGARGLLARAITLIESHHPEHQRLARQLLDRLMPKTGNSHRLGITGVPGVGKSSFIESFGLMLCETGRRIAVLAVDPSSGLSGGSIMGDKTRMERLANHPNAFIRPSPSGGSLGGVARRTRETLLLCEAAGFDLILVETVGVGQSEIAVAEMSDLFIALMLPGAGDELQGIKRGLLERADLIIVNKLDIDRPRVLSAVRDYTNALHYSQASHSDWQPQVLSCSALSLEGLAEVWTQIQAHRLALKESGRFQKQRQEQQLRWMWNQIEEGLQGRFREHFAAKLPRVEQQVRRGLYSATLAADQLLSEFFSTYPQ